jgi:hypothetical protein
VVATGRPRASAHAAGRIIGGLVVRRRVESRLMERLQMNGHSTHRLKTAADRLRQGVPLAR